MKKRLLIPSLIIALVFVLSMGLTACGDTGNNGGNGGDTDSEQPQTVAVTTVTLNKSTLTLDIGDEETLTATVKPDNATNKTVTWTSDTPAIASVDNGGKVTAQADGTAIITATADGKSDTCTVTVNKATTPPTPGPITPVENVTLNKSTLTLNIGGTETLTATVKPDDATDKKVTWTSDTPAIASVDNGGKVTAKADGTAIITATADGRSDTCTVTVNKATTPPDGDTNKYAPIVTALQAKVDEKYDNAEILTIFETNGYLACMIKNDNAVYGIRTMVKTEGHSLTADTIDTSYYVNGISTLLKLSQNNVGIYSSDGTDTDKQMVESMIAKLLGDGYTVMWGTISATRENGITTGLGDAESFSVYALIEKGGKIYEYSETLTVTLAYGNVYQTVLNSTDENKDNRYKSASKELTDLGELAKLYLAECKKEQQANPNTNKYAEIVTALQARLEQSYENAEILFIYEYETNSTHYLACKIKTADMITGICTRVVTDEHSLTVGSIDNSYYTAEIPNTRISSLGSFIKGLYNSDGIADDKQMVENMITQLLGDGYTVLYGTISAANDNMDHPTLGANASFNVKALLEKDGSVFEYSESLTVTKSFNDIYGDIYHTFLNIDEIKVNKDYVYSRDYNEPTDLGELAKLYLAELAKQ